MPTREQTTATPASRAMIEQFLNERKAQLWIGHSISFLGMRSSRRAGMS